MNNYTVTKERSIHSASAAKPDEERCRSWMPKSPSFIFRRRSSVQSRHRSRLFESLSPLSFVLSLSSSFSVFSVRYFLIRLLTSFFVSNFHAAKIAYVARGRYSHFIPRICTSISHPLISNLHIKAHCFDLRL